MMSRGQYPPMLLIYTNENETWNLYSVIKNKVLNMQMEVPDNYKRFCGSSKGWLIATDENLAVALINPLSRVKGREAKENSIIHLPPVAPPALSVGKRNFLGKNYERFVYKATITTDPIINPDDCIVVVIYVELCRLAFIRLNKDITWTYIAGDYRLIEEVAYVDRRFYAVDHWSKVLCLDINSQFNSDVKIVAHGMQRNQTWYIKIYLVDSNVDGLFLVHRYVNNDDERRVTRKFRVFAFDFSTLELTEKDTLGDAALFLGDNSSIFVSALRFPGCKPNCIYFNDDFDRTDDDRKPRDFGVYNFVNHKFSVPYNSRAKNLMKPTNRYPIWILPTVQL